MVETAEILEREDPLAEGKALQDCRKRLDLRVDELAQAANTSVAVIQNIESGRTKLRGARRDALWNALIEAGNAKCEREGKTFSRLKTLAKLCRTKDDLVLENSALEQRVGELTKAVSDLSNQLAEHIDVVRPALEKLERLASQQAGRILAENDIA